MSTYVEGLVKNWGEILDEGQEITNRKVKRATAVMLENQANYLNGRAGVNEASGTASTIAPEGGGNFYNGGAGDYQTSGEFHKIAIPMVRRTFPELIAHDIVGVQPMSQPAAL